MRDEYLGVINQMKEIINAREGIQYSVFESDKSKNNFTEIFLCDSEEVYDKLEEEEHERLNPLNERIVMEFAIQKKTFYTTKHEV
jgi:hypothetical protein